MKKVSVIIPNYNNAHYLGRAIQSVLDQTFSDYEIIVVDDGSSDDSREVAASFGEKVHYIWQENKGLGGARNTGIRAAGGEFIGLLDADDEWQPNYLERMIRLASQSSLGIVYYCRARAIDVNGNILPQIFGGPVIHPQRLYQALLRANFLIPSTILVRRSIFDKVGLFEQDIPEIHGCEDWDLWLQIAPYYEIVGTSECLVRYRIHSSALSAYPEKMQKAAMAVIQKHFGSDDGTPAGWSSEKRRAYGGLYRYQVISFIQRQADWSNGMKYFLKALAVDPSLATDLNLFYDLALGSQPNGYRGSNQQLDMENTTFEIRRMLAAAFSDPTLKYDRTLQAQAYSTAYHSLGLVAYNLGERLLSRRLFLQALKHSPRLIFNFRLLGFLFKSFLSRSFLMRLKKVLG